VSVSNGPAERTPQAVPLSKSDLQLITRALIGMVSIGEKVTFECLDNMPPSGSRAQVGFDSNPELMDAFLLMQYANLTGFDHVRAFIALLRTPTMRSTALATVTRGALEALARSYFLLSSSDTRTLLYRQLSMLHSDLKYPARFGEMIQTKDGDVLDPRAKRQHYVKELARLGLPAAVSIELAQAVATMLDAEFKDGQGLMSYSALSAVAHGHRLGVNTYVVRDEAGGVGSLAAPRDSVVLFAVQLMAAMSATMDSFVEMFGSVPRQVDLVRVATSRAAKCLSALESAPVSPSGS